MGQRDESRGLVSLSLCPLWTESMDWHCRCQKLLLLSEGCPFRCTVRRYRTNFENLWEAPLFGHWRAGLIRLLIQAERGHSDPTSEPSIELRARVFANARHTPLRRLVRRLAKRSQSLTFWLEFEWHHSKPCWACHRWGLNLSHLTLLEPLVKPCCWRQDHWNCLGKRPSLAIFLTSRWYLRKPDKKWILSAWSVQFFSLVTYNYMILIFLSPFQIFGGINHTHLLIHSFYTTKIKNKSFRI